MEQHVDQVALDWFNMEEKLQAKLPADDERSGKGGDYSYYSEPHTDDECPFRDGERRKMGAG